MASKGGAWKEQAARMAYCYSASYHVACHRGVRPKMLLLHSGRILRSEATKLLLPKAASPTPLKVP